ncbi:MAG: phosphatase PAP2 family protein [Patescibacteria group bacterium]|nr:phosphatase PAP2 family protein [Patescibacteria group bacterium]
MSNKKIHPLAILLFLTCLVGFALLTRMAYLQHLSGFDTTIARDVQRYNFGVLKPIMKVISLPGKTVFAAVSILAVAALFWWKKYPREALFILAIGAVDALSLIIKHVVNRSGPQHVGLAFTSTPEATFPSSHVVHYVVFFGLLAYFMLVLHKVPGKLRSAVSLISIMLIIAIPFSRVFLGEHWLSDVVGGLLLGMMALIVVIWLYSAPWFLPQIKSQSITADG